MPQYWEGWNVALKPAYEPIILAMKPRDGTFANNALRYGVAGLWIDGARVPTNGESWSYPNGPGGSDPNHMWRGRDKGNGEKAQQSHPQGRWPANLLLDEAAGAMLDAQSGERPSGELHPWHNAKESTGWSGGSKPGRIKHSFGGDTGGASRFFMRFAYVPKASRAERNAGLEGMEERDEKRYASGKGFAGRTQLEDGTWTNTDYENRKPIANHHPTVKPIALLEYLCRLTKTPTGGVVLDPFMGSGSTGIACVNEGRDFIGIELDAEYFEIAQRRIEHAKGQVRQLELIP